MSGPRPLFIIGSKRSGTSLLVSLLNQHPQVLVTHESDLVWILYQIYMDMPDRFRTYPLDEGKGMRETLRECGEILKSVPPGPGDKQAVVRAFYHTLTHINEQGRGRWDHPQKKRDLAWVGDKKPVQYSDPEVQSFLNALFPEAHYVHLIRNPRFVVASMMEAAETWGDSSLPGYWKQTPRQILERWTTHEEWVLRVKSRLPGKVHTIRLEDLAEDPVRVALEAFRFLDLDPPPDTKEVIEDWVFQDPNERHQYFDLDISPRARQVMQTYGYEE